MSNSTLVDIQNFSYCMLSNNNLNIWIPKSNENKCDDFDIKPKSNENKCDDSVIKPKQKNVDNDIYHPSYMKDKIFWCFYIIVEGIEKYEQAKEKTFRFETDFKFKCIDKLKLKETKFKSKLQEIETELITSKTITMATLNALANAYDKSIIFINDRIYYDFCYGEHYHLIEKKGDTIFLHTGDVKNKIDKIKADLFKVCFPKKINGISFYTSKDLQSFADKLNIEKTNENKKLLTKPQLYTEIVIKIEKLT